VFGVMRIVNVAHGEFFMLGAVLAWGFSSLVPGSAALASFFALVASRSRSDSLRCSRPSGAAPAPIQT